MQDMRDLARDFRAMANTIDNAADRLERLEAQPETKRNEFILAAIGVALDSYQPGQKTLGRLRSAWKHLENPEQIAKQKEASE